VIDFKLTETNDLAIANGDLVLTESTLQHQADIINAEKGWWHHAAALGVGLQSYLNESGTAPGLVASIRQELERDGMSVQSVAIGVDGITINATYPEP
jgi:hypothetical protein